MITAVPTNIITGFLGAGKTSLIMRLLEQKPKDERWAVLVNEFGQVGVDGCLLSASNTPSDTVFIREVPGGCMCCVAGLPMQIALNQLLARAKPSRLIIEPTGLGHPKQILQALTAEHYGEVLTLGPTLTLVDARVLLNPRYTTNDTFNQQIDIADIIIGSKSDLYESEDRDALVAYIRERNGDSPIILADRKGIDRNLLDTPNLNTNTAQSPIVFTAKKGEGRKAVLFQPRARLSGDFTFDEDIALPECGYLRMMNKDKDFFSIGWRFANDRRFDEALFTEWVKRQEVIRIKAAVITRERVIGYNVIADDFTVNTLSQCTESRIEMIVENYSDLAVDKVERDLLACVIN